jgi:hypothetical protein
VSDIAQSVENVGCGDAAGLVTGLVGVQERFARAPAPTPAAERRSAPGENGPGTGGQNGPRVGVELKIRKQQPQHFLERTPPEGMRFGKPAVGGHRNHHVAVVLTQEPRTLFGLQAVGEHGRHSGGEEILEKGGRLAMVPAPIVARGRLDARRALNKADVPGFGLGLDEDFGPLVGRSDKEAKKANLGLIDQRLVETRLTFAVDVDGRADNAEKLAVNVAEPAAVEDPLLRLGPRNLVDLHVALAAGVLQPLLNGTSHRPKPDLGPCGGGIDAGPTALT